MSIRSRKIAACTFSILVTITNLAIAYFAVVIMIAGIGMLSAEIPQQNSITQILDDWAVVPFVNITIRTSDCLADEDPVFHMDYAGVNDGWLCNGGTTVSLE